MLHSAQVVFTIQILPLRPGRNVVSSNLVHLQCRVSKAMGISFSIIGSLAGTSYYGPVAGHGLLTHDLELIRSERKRHQVEKSGVVGGPIEAISAGEQADNYVMIKKKDEEEKEGEGEKAGEGEKEGEREKEGAGKKDENKEGEGDDEKTEKGKEGDKGRSKQK